MTPRIQKAIDTFLDSLNEGTLAKGTCVACAVGNLVAAGAGAKITEDLESCAGYLNSTWSFAFSTNSEGTRRIDKSYFDNEEVIDNISKTDFSIHELMQIEYAFETNTEISYISYDNCSRKSIRQDQIKGLEAVVKVMLSFDEQVEDVKEVFTHKAELIPL